jgi:hypothetical protein
MKDWTDEELSRFLEGLAASEAEAIEARAKSDAAFAARLERLRRVLPERVVLPAIALPPEVRAHAFERLEAEALLVRPAKPPADLVARTLARLEAEGLKKPASTTQASAKPEKRESSPPPIAFPARPVGRGYFQGATLRAAAVLLATLGLGVVLGYGLKPPVVRTEIAYVDREKIVEKPVEIVKEVPRDVVKYVDREVVKVVEKPVEVVREVVKEVPVEKVVEHVVVKEVPVDRVVEHVVVKEVPSAVALGRPTTAPRATTSASVAADPEAAVPRLIALRSAGLPEERAQAQHELERLWATLGDPGPSGMATVTQVLGKSEPTPPATASDWEAWWSWARARRHK